MCLHPSPLLLLTTNSALRSLIAAWPSVDADMNIVASDIVLAADFGSQFSPSTFSTSLPFVQRILGAKTRMYGITNGAFRRSRMSHRNSRGVRGRINFKAAEPLHIY